MFTTVASLLENRIGLAVEAMGSELIARIVRRHMSESGLSDEKEYLDLLRKSAKLWDSLVEAVVIPETWFFRNWESFSFLGRFVQSEWLVKHKQGVLRVLSVPCATGEEPYSIAMALMDAGVPPERFHIEAMDISSPLLEKAKSGIYGPESFRGQDVAFRERYFDPSPEGFRLKRSVMDAVRFFKGNLLDGQAPSKGIPYNAIFCRNLLIYLTPYAKKRTASLLDRLLDKEGVIFVGHIEHEIFNKFGFEKIRQPKVFACRRTGCPRKGRVRAREKSGEGSTPMLPTSSVPLLEKGGNGMASSKFLLKSTELGSDLERKPACLGRLTGEAKNRGEGQETGRVESSEQDLKVDRGEKLLFDEAQKLADQGLLDDALGLCKELLRGNALHVQCHFLMALICMALNDNKGAVECFNKAAYLDPNNDEALDYLAFIAEQDGDWSGAAQLRQRAQRIRARENKC